MSVVTFAVGRTV